MPPAPSLAMVMTGGLPGFRGMKPCSGPCLRVLVPCAQAVWELGRVGVGGGPAVELCDPALVYGGGFRVELLEWEDGGSAGVHFGIWLRHVFPRMWLSGYRWDRGQRRLETGELARVTGPRGRAGLRAFPEQSRERHPDMAKLHVGLKSSLKKSLYPGCTPDQLS